MNHRRISRVGSNRSDICSSSFSLSFIVTMAKNHSEIEREIRRIQGQLLVAKQICRENLDEINRLKFCQKPDSLLEQVNHLLTIKTSPTKEHVEQFNALLRQLDEQRPTSNSFSESIVSQLASNVKQLESLFDYAETLLTQPLTSIQPLNKTISLDELDETKTISSNDVDLNDLDFRIEKMKEKVSNIDHCYVQ